MPGFNIGIKAADETGGDRLRRPSFNVDAVTDLHRAHRWRLDKLLDWNFESAPLYPLEVSIPATTVEEENVGGANIDYKIPKKVKYGDFTIKIYDHARMLGELLKNIMIPAGIFINPNSTATPGLRRADQYMGTVRVLMEDGSGKPVVAYEGLNCYLKEVTHSELTYSSSDFKMINMTIGCGILIASSVGNVSLYEGA